MTGMEKPNRRSIVLVETNVEIEVAENVKICSDMSELEEFLDGGSQHNNESQSKEQGEGEGESEED